MLNFVGWGSTEYNGDYSDTLQEVRIPIVTNEVCSKAMGELHEGHICAGGEKNVDACGGDSGGPMSYYKHNKAHVLVGLTSYGEKCGLEGKYGVYSKISYYKDWIMSNLKSPVFCSK